MGHKINVLKHIVFMFLVVAETNMTEFDFTFFHFFICHRCFFIIQIHFRIQHFQNTVGRCHRTGSLDKDHGNHHEGHKDLGNIGSKRSQISYRHTAHNDLTAAKPHNSHNRNVHSQCHDRDGHDHYFHSPQSVIFQIFVGCVKCLFLKIVPYKGFYNSLVSNVLLNTGVKGVDLCLHDIKSWQCHPHDKNDGYDQKRNDHAENDGQTPVHNKCHDQSADEHSRCSQQHTKSYGNYILHIGNIIGQPGYKGTG